MSFGTWIVEKSAKKWNLEKTFMMLWLWAFLVRQKCQNIEEIFY
jgi:hypothetical protein